MALLSKWSHLHLEPHPIARDRTVAKSRIPTATVIITVPALVTALLNSEKGRRCDMCNRLGSTESPLRKCSGCSMYWYCGTACQREQWRSHHKRICAHYNQYIASPMYQALLPYEQMDALLLSHLVVQSPSTITTPHDQNESPMSIFLSLLPGPMGDDFGIPPVCSGSSLSADILRRIYCRFGNNNFSIHSHLTTIGHGIFPLASRLFNHNCSPNAVAKYVLQPGQPAQMQIVALRDIQVGEEICLPYLDPALHQSRRQIFEITYGFHCGCIACQFLDKIGQIPALSNDPRELAAIDSELQRFVIDEKLATEPKGLDCIPDHLICVLHEGYMTRLSEQFSRSSHEGHYDLAISAGQTLLSLYSLVYPLNYPQIGMHLLEMAKTGWNAMVSTGMSGDAENLMQDQVRTWLTSAHKILQILGPEGDEDGPLQEIEVLQSLLSHA
ncbi:hypothetical protein BD779DRAFT_1737353 [Infundibulicybe gibba]|nr:hypothetical protein BD779DRAFT_1737353 [Infundibulicybe gibba]